MRKKVFAALLAVCMVVAMLPVSAFAAGEEVAFTVSEDFQSALEALSMESFAGKSKDDLAKLSNVKVSNGGEAVDGTFTVTGEAYLTHWKAFNTAVEAEQTGYYLALAVDYPTTGVEVYLQSNGGEYGWKNEEETFKKIVGNATAADDIGVIFPLISKDGVTKNDFTLRVVKTNEALAESKTLEAEYVDYTIDVQGVECKNVVLDQPFMVDEKDDWDEMIKDVTFDPEETAKWNATTIGTYPAIAFTYESNNNVIVEDGVYFGIQVRTAKKDYIFKLDPTKAPVEETGKNYCMVSLPASYDLNLPASEWEQEYTVCPVIFTADSIAVGGLGSNPAILAFAGDPVKVSYQDDEPVAKIEATNTDVFVDFDTEDDTKLVAEGTVTYQDGKGYMLNLTITDDDNANSRAMKTVTLKAGETELVKANFDKGVAKVALNVAADALKKAEDAKPTDPDPKASIVMEIAYGYQDEGTNEKLKGSKLSYTLDITAVETEVADKAIAESTTEVSVSDGTAAVSNAAVQNDLTLAIAQKRKEDGVASDATVTVPEVKLTATDAETVELGAAVLETLNKEEYAVEKVTIDNGSVVVGLPAEVVGGEEYRDEAGALTVEVKEVAKPADKKVIADQIEGIERGDLEQVYNISVPTAENGVTGLTDPITLTFKVTNAKDYKVVYIDGSEITIVDSEGKDNILTAKVTHLSTYAVVKESVLIARDPSMAITVTGNEVKKGTLVPGVGTPLTAKLTGDVKAGDVAVFQIMDANGKYSVGVQVLAAGDQDILTYARGTVETVDLFILRGNTIVKSVSELTIK